MGTAATYRRSCRRVLWHTINERSSVYSFKPRITNREKENCWWPLPFVVEVAQIRWVLFKSSYWPSILPQLIWLLGFASNSSNIRRFLVVLLEWILRQRKRVKSLKICKNLSQCPKLTCETETYGFRNDTTLSMTVIDCLATVAIVIWRKSMNFANLLNFRLSDLERITNGTSWEIEKSVDLNLWKTHVVLSLPKNIFFLINARQKCSVKYLETWLSSFNSYIW